MATSSGEHVGRQSDSINNEDDGYRRSAAARMAAVAKPQGKTFRRDANYKDTGDGDHCPTVDLDGRSLGHGKMYVLSGGKQWCPHQTHDMGVPRSGVYEGRKEPQDA